MNWTEALNIATDDTASYQVTELANGVEYDIQVRARNDSGAGAWSESFQGTTTDAMPTAPTVVSVKPRSKELTVVWTQPLDGTASLTQYDLRHIRSDAADKATDSNWTESNGAWRSAIDEELQASIGGLTSTLLSNGLQYEVQVRARNAVGTGPWSATTTMSVATPVAVNRQPAFPATEAGARQIDENTAAGRPIGAPVRATDDDSTLVYTLTGTDAASFDFNRSNGQILTKDRLNHESKDMYRVAVHVTDGQDDNDEADGFANDAEKPVTITVNDVNEAPEIAPATVHFDFREDRANWNVSTFSASDPEMDTIGWSVSGEDQSQFQIDQFGQLSFRQAPDADQPSDSGRNNKYEVNVVASDGRLTDTLDVTVEIENVDEPPVVGGDADIEVNENSTSRVGAYTASDPENPSNPVVWSLGGSHASQFELRGTSRGRRDLYFKSPPDYETQQTYGVTVRASDGSLPGRLEVNIEVTDLDEGETLSVSTDRPVQDIAINATLNEADRVSASNRTWLWERSANRSSWSAVGSNSPSYTPTLDDVDSYLRVTITYDDGHAADKTLRWTSSAPVSRNRANNNSPTFPSGQPTRTVRENSGAGIQVGAPVVADDADDDPLRYSLSGSDAANYEISSSGQITVKPGALINYEVNPSHIVTVTARDDFGGEGSIPVTITIEDVDESPTAMDDSASTLEDTPELINVLSNDSDPERQTLTISPTQGRTARGGAWTVDGNLVLYEPALNYHGQDSFSYRISDGTHSNRPTATAIVVVTPVNDPPVFPDQPVELSVAQNAVEGASVGRPVTATDVDGDRLTYSAFGASEFTIDENSGQILVAANAMFDPTIQDTYTLTVQARDQDFASDTSNVTIKVVERVAPPIIVGPGGGGGGGAPPVPIPSDEDFDWNVTRDIEELDRTHETPTDIWSDGETVWALNNASSGADAVFAYALDSGERREHQEFALDNRNRFSHGIWSDAETVWIADSGQDKLFAYTLASGERDEEGDIVLAERNRDPRGIWSNGDTIYVLDAVKNALFSYSLESGEPLTEYALASLNNNPRGIWSDGFILWISDDGANRVFAYRIENGELVRQEDEEFGFRVLLKAGNGDIRGIWSDGDILFAVDQQDRHIRSYNIPDASQAYLRALSLSGIELDGFSPLRLSYESSADAAAVVTTVEAAATQESATVSISPTDADSDLENGHQVSLGQETIINVTVTSADENRTRSYNVSVNKPTCLSGLTSARLSKVVYSGGTVADLEACARSMGVDAFFHNVGRSWTALFIDAPSFLSRTFRNRFADGIPAGEPLIAARYGIASQHTPAEGGG